MEFSDSKKFQGILLFLGFTKAFNTLEWGFISKTLEVLILEISSENSLLF